MKPAFLHATTTFLISKLFVEQTLQTSTLCKWKGAVHMRCLFASPPVQHSLLKQPRIQVHMICYSPSRWLIFARWSRHNSFKQWRNEAKCADHKSATLSTPQTFAQEYKITESHLSCFIQIYAYIWNIRTSLTLKSNTYKLKSALFFILLDGSCFFCLFATIVIICSSNIFCLFSHASMYTAYLVNVSSPLAFSPRKPQRLASIAYSF